MKDLTGFTTGCWCDVNPSANIFTNETLKGLTIILKGQLTSSKFS